MARSLDLIFDGQCGFCTRSVHWLRRLDKHDRIRLHPSQRAGVLEQFDLRTEQVDSAAWAVDGQLRTSGAGAVNLALDVALGSRVFFWAYHLPGIHRLQDFAYRLVAARRGLLRGVEPWCTTHPDDCGASDGQGSCENTFT